VACHWAEQIRAGEIAPRHVDEAAEGDAAVATASDPA
jgi:hypothetical protein